MKIFLMLFTALGILTAVLLYIYTEFKYPIGKAGYESEENHNYAWGRDFLDIEIKSPLDGKIQHAFFYNANTTQPAPLIVSLHQWSSTYQRYDKIADLSKTHNINYIRPDFRGMMNNPESCCSDYVISDIDTAIDYALKHSNVDPEKIYVIGASGGGYTAFCAYIKLQHKIKKFAAWIPISDLSAWYHEVSLLKKDNYAQDILQCTSSKGSILDEKNAKTRSPLYWTIPSGLLENSSLSIFAGGYDGDGDRGAVSPAHAINFYNKLLAETGGAAHDSYVSEKEKLFLLEHRKPLGNFGKLADRKIFLHKNYKNVNLTIFEGGHEKMSDYAFEELLQ